MRVRRDEGVAIRIGPEPCAVTREGIGEASARERRPAIESDVALVRRGNQPLNSHFETCCPDYEGTCRQPRDRPFALWQDGPEQDCGAGKL